MLESVNIVCASKFCIGAVEYQLQQQHSCINSSIYRRIGDTSVQLPVLLSLIACCRPVNVPQPVGITDPEMAARLDCINHLSALLPELQTQAHRGGIQTHPQGKPGGQRRALAEDWQLRGFLPLQQCHERLTFEQQEAQAQVTACYKLHALVHPSIHHIIHPWTINLNAAVHILL